jgi:hypothetical protein
MYAAFSQGEKAFGSACMPPSPFGRGSGWVQPGVRATPILLQHLIREMLAPLASYGAASYGATMLNDCIMASKSVRSGVNSSAWAAFNLSATAW